MSSEFKGPGDDARRQAPLFQIVVGVAACLVLLYFLRTILAPFFTALLIVALIEGFVRALAHRWPAGPRCSFPMVAYLKATSGGRKMTIGPSLIACRNNTRGRIAHDHLAQRREE